MKFKEYELPFNSFMGGWQTDDKIIDDMVDYYNDNKDYRIQKIFSRCSKQYDKNNVQTLFFLGDSYTHSFWLGAEYIAKVTNSSIFTLSAPQTPFPTNKYQKKKQKIVL